jgi:hypothetical protein
MTTTETTTAESNWTPRSDEARAWDSTMRTMRRRLTRACVVHGLPKHEIRVPRGNYHTSAKRVEVVNVETGEVMHSDTLQLGNSVSIPYVTITLLMARDGTTREDAERLYKEKIPKPKPCVPPKWEVDSRPKAWKWNVTKENRYLEKLCERHGLPVHRVKVSRGRRGEKKIFEVVNAATKEVVSEQFMVETGFQLIEGGFNPDQIIYNLLSEQAGATTEEVDRLYNLNEARARELSAERRDFNRWTPYSITNHHGATNLPAIELALEVARRDLTDDELLRLYKAKAEAFSRLTKEEKRRAYSDAGNRARFDAFKQLLRSLRLRVYRCVKCHGLNPATATLEQLKARKLRRKTSSIATTNGSYKKRPSNHKKADTRFDYRSPVSLSMEGGGYKVMTFDNDGKQDFGSAEHLGDSSGDAPSFTQLTPAEHMAKIREIKERIGMRGGA